MGRYLLVGWDGGGNLQPLLGIARMLASRGHDVRTLAWGTTAERVEATGSEYVSIEEPTFDQEQRMWEEQTDESLFVGLEIAEMVPDHGRTWPADVVVVDALLQSALCGAEASGIPTAAFVHVQWAFLDFPPAADPQAWGWDFAGVNGVRQRLGLEPLMVEDGRVVLQLYARCLRAISVIPREFERPDLPIPSNVVHVGPIFEGTSAVWPDDLPWPADDPRPLVVVSHSTTYMRHEHVIGRILRALEPMDARVLVTLGSSKGALRPDEVPEGPWAVRTYVPHLGVLPHASLVVTHAGMGTVMAAFASGVPMLCLPGGRDQGANAERVEALGAGRALEQDAPVGSIASAVEELLSDERVHRGASRVAELVASYGGGARAIHELERLLPR